MRDLAKLFTDPEPKTLTKSGLHDAASAAVKENRVKARLNLFFDVVAGVVSIHTHNTRFHFNLRFDRREITLT